MPDRRAVTGERVWCYCGINKYAQRLDQLLRAGNIEDNEDNAENSENGMDIDHTMHNAHQYKDRGGDLGLGDNSFNNIDAYMGAHLDSKLSELEDLHANWHNIDNPVCIPLQTPTPPPDNEEPPDEDGFAHITEEDYCEYNCWFDKDTLEMDNIIAKTLTKEEMDSIKMMAIRLFGHISQRNYKRSWYSFWEKIYLLSAYCLHQKLAILSGISPQPIDCCINVCHAFTGPYANEDICSTCKEPRYDSKGRPRQEEGRMDDYIDLQRYKDLCESNIIVKGEDLGVRYFHGSCNIAYAVMTDGVNLFKQAHSEKSTCWPIMAINLNLPASKRVKLCNLIPLGVIPGPNQPKDFDSYLEPFVGEAIKQACGVETYDVTRQERFKLRAHAFLISGNMQAIKHVTQMKGPNGKVPCRACEAIGVYHTCRKGYYIPLANPANYPDAIPDGRPDPQDFPPNTIPSYNPLNLPLRTKARIADQLGEMDAANTKRQRDALSKNYRLINHLILDRIPLICWPDLYPHKYLHLFLLNHGRELISLWTGSCHSIDDSGNEDYLISADDWAAIGLETKEASKTLPAAFIRPLPNIQTSQAVFCGETWAFWLVFIGPVVLRGRLAKKYYEHYLELVEIMKCLTSVTNTTAQIEQLRDKIAHYVKGFEE
ncbi:Transposase family Tnp2 protein [Rhizoctonia solani]|uniref:Transposase family Tnp2 protein n=1 Tax=Rhizoctonia solani TaxID=456999 RepID=A0A8H8P982_9AGAM|nr:Transposase family Tnp2 protein [Rhizoctonia solani]QRW26138.1 Transposase family Tnp2 protein [Rhizoctonia solani]